MTRRYRITRLGGLFPKRQSVDVDEESLGAPLLAAIERKRSGALALRDTSADREHIEIVAMEDTGVTKITFNESELPPEALDCLDALFVR